MKEFFFSKYNLLHTLAHLLTGGIIGNALFAVTWYVFGGILLSHKLYFLGFFASYFVVGMLAFIIEYVQFWAWKKDEYYKSGYVLAWVDYQPFDQARDFIEHILGASTCLFWLI